MTDRPGRRLPPTLKTERAWSPGMPEFTFHVQSGEAWVEAEGRRYSIEDAIELGWLKVVVG